MRTHPETLQAVWKKYIELVKSHPESFAQKDGALTLWKYASKMVRIQAEIDTIKLLQEITYG